MSEIAEQVVFEEYKPGQGIGRHTDLKPQSGTEPHAGFGPVVVSVSILSPCVMRFSHPEKGANRTSRWSPEVRSL